MIEATELSKSIGNRKILHNVDIQINENQVVSLLGPSGCGKTTLLKNLILVDKPDMGTLTIDKFKYFFPNSNNVDTSELYPLCTIVFQQFALFPHLTIQENLLLPIKKEFTTEKKNLLEELTDKLGISDLERRYPHQISVGQKQRVAIARAILLQPKYLLLDEITSSLDVEHIEKVMRLIKELSAKGTGILLTTHLIGFAKNVADKVYFMDNGRIIESGDNSIFGNPQSDRFKAFISLMDLDSRYVAKIPSQ